MNHWCVKYQEAKKKNDFVKTNRKWNVMWLLRPKGTLERDTCFVTETKAEGQKRKEDRNPNNDATCTDPYCSGSF